MLCVGGVPGGGRDFRVPVGPAASAFRAKGGEVGGMVGQVIVK